MKTVKGDLVALAKAGEFDVIVHGCNCFHTMGAGVALQLATEFAGEHGPIETDMKTEFGDRSKLGSYSIATGFADDGTPFAIVNAYTQYSTASADDKTPVDYDAIRHVFHSLGVMVQRPRQIRIGYPAIGAGLAGGDWERISGIIAEELRGHNHTYVEYVPAAPDPRQQLAQRLRDACGADIWCDTEVGITDGDDDWVTDVDNQIDDAIAAMTEAADLLDPRS
jgi:O-acetyl-ADP-ribose deacetylase (regulator of RNase III)